MLLPASSYRRVPWKNGGGFTFEVARDTEHDEPDWRLSIATIERDGPFSHFPGYDRTIVVLDGGGIELDVDGKTAVLHPFDPFAFSGDASAASRLLGSATHDLNVMTKRARCSHLVEIVRLMERSGQHVIDEATQRFVYCAAGRLIVDTPGAPTAVTTGDTLRIVEKGPITLRAAQPAAAAIVMLLRSPLVQ